MSRLRAMPAPSRPRARADALRPAPALVRGTGDALMADERAFFEHRLGHDFGDVRIHADERAAASADAVSAHAYAVGRDVVFARGAYEPETAPGRRLLAHELAHVVQQAGGDGRLSAAAPAVQRQPRRPYIDRIDVNLAPSQNASLHWRGAAPASPGSDSFTVSTGKGYGDPGDPPDTCSRACCDDASTQCAPPWNQPRRRGACCTPFGTFYTGTRRPEHNGWLYWTPVEPLHTAYRRGIALHQHTEVTGQPIGHGCIRMDEANAERIYRYSRGRNTAVVISGRAAPVHCPADRQCAPPSGGGGALRERAPGEEETALARADEEPPGGGGAPRPEPVPAPTEPTGEAAA